MPHSVHLFIYTDVAISLAPTENFPDGEGIEVENKTPHASSAGVLEVFAMFWLGQK